MLHVLWNPVGTPDAILEVPVRTSGTRTHVEPWYVRK
jgi:hypothetical protein